METERMQNLNEELKTLDYNQTLTFGYLICKKLFPDYATFSEYEDFGKPDVLYSVLIALRKKISGVDNSENINKLIKELWNDEEIAPDTDDFPGNLSASLALNTVSALYHCLKYATKPTYDLILKVSDISLESVSSYFIVSNNIDQNLPETEYELLLSESVLIQSEIRLQESLVEKIKNLGGKHQRIYTRIKIHGNKLVENNLVSQFIYT